MHACVCVSASADSSRVKRMCVAERRQPYSGADWCSGGESDEDDKGFFSKFINVCIQALSSEAFADHFDALQYLSVTAVQISLTGT